MQVASEAVQAFGSAQADTVEYKSVNVMALATQQRRNIHRDLGIFQTRVDRNQKKKHTPKLPEQGATVSQAFGFASPIGVVAGNLA